MNRWALLSSFVIAASLLSGCGQARDKVSGYFLSKAKKTASLGKPSQKDIEKAYASLGRALAISPESAEAIETLSVLSETAAKTGFQKAYLMETSVLEKVLKKNPKNLKAAFAVIEAFSLKGDLYGLNRAASLISAADNDKAAHALLAFCYFSMLPWIESDGYLNLSRDHQTAIARAGEYSTAAGLMAKNSALAMERQGGLPERISASFSLVRAESERIRSVAGRMGDFVSTFGNGTEEGRAFEMFVEGNRKLLKKDYPAARAFYQGALLAFPDFADALKQSAETDFQEGAALAISGRTPEAMKDLERAYSSCEALIGGFPKGSEIPFVQDEKFRADVYSLKAAVLMARRTLEKGDAPDRGGREKEFVSALNSALKLNPGGRLAQELFERYTKHGF